MIDVLRESGVKPEAAQKLMDQHVGAMQQLQAHIASEQQRIWQETRAGWRKDVMADEQIGGAGHQTALQAIARMRDQLVHPSDMPAFNDRKNELSSDDRRALADYLIWLRTATPADITKLGEL